MPILTVLAAQTEPGINQAAVIIALVLLAATILVILRRRGQPPIENRRRGYAPPAWEDTRSAALAAEAARGEIGEAHAAHYLDLARVSQRDFAVLEQELGKIEDAIAWCVANRRHRMVVDYMWALDPFLTETGRAADEKRLLRQALASARAGHDAMAAAAFSHNLAMLLVDEGDDGAALPLFEESLRTERASKDRAGAANTLLQMAAIYERRGDVRKAQELRKKADSGK